jgi:hypothetical protein
LAGDRHDLGDSGALLPAPHSEHLLRHAPWRKAFEAELLTFPSGKHDDQVDALGLVGQLLDKMIRGTARKPEPKEPRDSWARMFNRQDLGVADWRIA